eukprot:1177474-Prorocentrum_minimum.AAC.3
MSSTSLPFPSHCHSPSRPPAPPPLASPSTHPPGTTLVDDRLPDFTVSPVRVHQPGYPGRVSLNGFTSQGAT